MSHEFYLIDEIPLFLILLWAKELSFCHSLVETRLQIECQTPCQKHSQMYFQKHIQPKCVGGGKRGTVITNVLCYGHQTMAQGLAASKSFVQKPNPMLHPKP